MIFVGYLYFLKRGFRRNYKKYGFGSQRKGPRHLIMLESGFPMSEVLAAYLPYLSSKPWRYTHPLALGARPFANFDFLHLTSGRTASETLAWGGLDGSQGAPWLNVSVGPSYLRSRLGSKFLSILARSLLSCVLKQRRSWQDACR